MSSGNSRLVHLGDRDVFGLSSKQPQGPAIATLSNTSTKAKLVAFVAHLIESVPFQVQLDHLAILLCECRDPESKRLAPRRFNLVPQHVKRLLT